MKMLMTVANKAMMKVAVKVSIYALLIGVLVFGSSLAPGFASVQSVQDEYVFAEDDDCICSGEWCEYFCDRGCTGDCAPERGNYDGCAEDPDCPCSGLYCEAACDSGCAGDCMGDGGNAYTGCADMCCINDTDCKHECPNHANCDCPEDEGEDNGGDSTDPSDPNDNNGKYPIDTTVPWWRPPAELTGSGDLILTFIYTGELDDLWIWRSDNAGEDWVPYWNTLGSGTANGRITVTSERPEGDYLYVTIPDAEAEFPAVTSLVFETQHPEIICYMSINFELEFGWVDTLGKGGDRTGADKFPRPQAGGEGNKPPYSVPNKPPANVPDTDGGKSPDGTNTGTEPPPATGSNTSGERPSGTRTVPGNQLRPADDSGTGGGSGSGSGGSTTSGSNNAPTVVVSGDSSIIDPATRSELNATDSSAASEATATDEYPSTSDIAPDVIPKTEPSTEDMAAPSAWSNRVFTAMIAIGIAAALLVGVAIWVKRRKLRSR